MQVQQVEFITWAHKDAARRRGCPSKEQTRSVPLWQMVPPCRATICIDLFIFLIQLRIWSRTYNDFLTLKDFSGVSGSCRILYCCLAFAIENPNNVLDFFLAHVNSKCSHSNHYLFIQVVVNNTCSHWFPGTEWPMRGCRSTGPLTTAEHSLTLKQHDVGKVSCPRTQ